jgi:hypothetical protein
MPVRQPIEEEYLEVFQNLESMIISVYRQTPELMDWDVEVVVDALIRRYQAEMRDREPQPPRLTTESREELFYLMEGICQWYLGQKPEFVSAKDGAPVSIPAPDPLTLEELVAILKRIRKSIRVWNKRGGIRGYLNFIGEFIP